MRIIRLDRSRIVARQECPRLRVLNYHLGGLGIERIQRSLPLATGIAVHEALAKILTGESVDASIESVINAYRAEITSRGIEGVEDTQFLIGEQSALVSGLIRGWVKVRLPLILAEFEVVSVEQEFEWELAPGIVQMMRMDVILRHKIEGTLFILEFKTVANPGYSWQQGWERNIQFMSYTQALREHTGEEVGGVIVEGLTKGSRKLETAASSPFNGRMLQQSPFCYAYRTLIDKNPEAPMYSGKWQPGKAWTKVAIWEEAGLLKDWIHLMDEETLRAQFITVPPICPLPEQIKRWRRQVIAAESRFQLGLDALAACEEMLDSLGELVSADDPDFHAALAKREEIMDFYFPQHDNHCVRYGSPCAFSDVCFNDLVGEDPIGSGLYQARVPHHTTELEG
jgi:hypothetical protein